MAEELKDAGGMSDDDAINEMVADIVSALVDMSPEEAKTKLAEYDLPPEWQEDILEMVNEVQKADSIADDPSSLNNGVEDFSDKTEAEAQSMADEDDTPVTVTEEDTDADGDADKTTIEKDEPEDDSEEDSNKDKDNSNESEDKPHDSKVTSDVRMKNIDNSTNSIAKTLANYRW